MYTSTSTKSLLLKATSFSTSPGNNISFSNFEYVISFVLSLLKKYCSPKNPRIINIHNHIILNFGGIGVTFLFGIFFITILLFLFLLLLLVILTHFDRFLPERHPTSPLCHNGFFFQF